MLIDADTVDALTQLRADVVVVGAGPAGIVCALELAKGGLSVILAESGKEVPLADIQTLGDADYVDFGRHAPMSQCTRRQVGGASIIWGGRCVPFDPIDFENRPHINGANWPIKYTDVEAWFERSCQYLFCGDAVFNTAGIPEIRQKTIVPGLPDGQIKSSDLERWSLPTNFGREYRRTLVKSDRITLVSGLTCHEIKASSGSGSVTHLVASTRSKKRIELKAHRCYVLACGGLETTRLLMASNGEGDKGIGNKGDCLGRFYMGHISGRIARVRFHTDGRKTIYGFLRDSSGVYLRPRFTFSRECQLNNHLANIGVSLVNPTIGNPAHRNGVLSFAYLALTSPLGKYFASEAIRRAAISGAPDRCVASHVWNMVRDLPRTAWFVPTFGIKRFCLWRRVPGFFQPSSANVYDLHYHGEHVPNYDSRVTLSAKTDAIGLRRLNIDLRFTQRDVDSVVRAHELIDTYLRVHNVGELEYVTADHAQSVWDQAADGCHQSGTTRMSLSAVEGVVDANCRVHGVDNLYVSSSSVFPTSGQANPTFMVVVFALRLADHIKGLLCMPTGGPR